MSLHFTIYNTYTHFFFYSSVNIRYRSVPFSANPCRKPCPEVSHSFQGLLFWHTPLHVPMLLQDQNSRTSLPVHYGPFDCSRKPNPLLLRSLPGHLLHFEQDPRWQTCWESQEPGLADCSLHRVERDAMWIEQWEVVGDCCSGGGSARGGDEG